MGIDYKKFEDPCLKCANLMTVRGTINMPRHILPDREWEKFIYTQDYCLLLGGPAPMGKFVNMEDCTKFVAIDEAS